MKGRLKILWGLTSLLMVTALILASCGTTGSTTTVTSTSTTTTESERVFRLTFQGKWVGHEEEGWAAAQLRLADRVAELTDGRIIINNVNEIVSDSNVLDGVRTGVLDIAVQTLFSRGELKMQNFISLPFVDFDHVYDLLQETKSITIPAWDDLGVKCLGYNVFLPQGLFTTEPCDTFDDLTSMKLRITGSILVDLINKAGGNPLTMENDAVYQALQLGTIDGAQTALAGYVGNAWYEVAEYVSFWPLGCNGFGIIVNQDVWDDLGPDLQAKLMQAVAEEELDQYESATADIENILAAAEGSIVMNPTQAEKDKMLAYLEDIIADWKAEVGEDKANEILAIVNQQLGTDY